VEFFARLVAGHEQFATGADRESRRLELLKQILLDVREQTDWLVEPRPGISQAVAPDISQTVAPDIGFDANAREQLRQIAETAAEVRAALRPGRAVWQGMLPLRRQIARLRGKS
jgi:hypothetical protein